MLVQAIGLLVTAQHLPYTGDEDADENDILQNERIELLRKNGMAVPA